MRSTERSIPWSVWRLMVAYALMMAGVTLMVLIAGIIGTDFAPTAGLATLPIALSVVGLACSTLPTGKLLQRFGRRPVFLAYGLVAMGSAALAAAGLVLDSFAVFCLAAFAMGWAGATGHQYRFAALELVPAEVAPKATSALLLGGILAAFIGPELAVAGRFLMPTEFAGSFILLVGSYAVGLATIFFYRELPMPEAAGQAAGRPMREILRSPMLLLAIAAAALGYGVMTFLMTATPISMHKHAGHSLEATKYVIQSHITAMYLPALIYAWLVGKIGYRGMLWAGIGVYLLTLAVAAWNTQFIHFWLAMVLLGVGWNFLFLSGTNMLPSGYRPAERFRVQSVNDFLVFSAQAVASLASGWVLYRSGWEGVIWVCTVPVAIFVLVLWLARKRRFSTVPAEQSL